VIMNSRVIKVQRQLAKLSVDGLLVTDPYNISYLAEYKCRDAYLIVTAKKALYLTDGRYTQEMKKNLPGFSVIDFKPSLLTALARLCRSHRIARLGFEEQQVTFSFYKKTADAVPAALVPVSGVVEALRRFKDAGEIAKIRRATQIAMQACCYIKDFLRPGIREIEVAAELERFIRFEGASSASFDIIVASGPNSSMPHYQTSERKLQAAEPVLIDMGVEFQGYKSDLTRVFFVGKINTLVARVYAIVRSAQAAALAAVKPGVSISSIDRAAREYISARGYGRHFVHSLGHGVGLQVHEAPFISSKVEQVVRPGEVFTIEPGIYIPGRFGIRIEDMVLVTNKGCEVFSGSLNK